MLKWMCSKWQIYVIDVIYKAMCMDQDLNEKLYIGTLYMYKTPKFGKNAFFDPINVIFG